MVKAFGQPWEGAVFPPRKWQADALPVVIDAVRGRKNAIISAVTGAGKSVLISELCWMALAKIKDRDDLAIVISTPTQNLVQQLSETISERVGYGLVGQYYGKRKQADRKVIVTCTPSVESLCGALAGRRTALLVADEVHKTEGEKIREAIQLLNPASRIGFTATAFRADEGETLSLWDVIAYQYTLGDAWRDNVLVPFVPIPYDGEGSIEDVDGWCLRAMQRERGPGVVSALSIPDAEDYARYLTAHDFPAEAVHSRRKDAQNKATLKRLLDGEIRCVVHVAMLSEGVDIPCLRWICLRRPVGSRVRFVQEVGRVLRTIRQPDQWGTKTTANVIDPHGLFFEHGIAHPAALGEPPPKKPKAEASAMMDLPPLPGLSAEMPPMQQVSIASTWARSMLLVMQADGLALPTPTQWVDGQWRSRRPSPKLIRALGKMEWASRYVPEPHRASIKWAIKASDRLKAGACSDLFNVLRAVADASEPKRKQRTHWKWPSNVHIPPLQIDSL